MTSKLLWVRFITIISFLSGCASMLPRIESLHPSGYSKLVEIIHECRDTDLDNYSACLTASKLLESRSGKQATIQFITHWEETAFGLADRMEKHGEQASIMTDPIGGALDSIVWGSVKNDSIVATQRIVLPILIRTYESSDDRYSKAMLSVTDLIVLTSKASFDSFREAHVKAVLADTEP